MHEAVINKRFQNLCSYSQGLKYIKMRVICTICARGGSKGLKNKNLIKLKRK